MNQSNGRRIRFGAYEADLDAGELRMNGKRLPLQEQPFQVLATLLDHPGEVVTREYLRERLWPGQPFVDFDQGLNTAINKLRDALGDSAASPRFIETVPRRGYRFTFPVEVAAATPSSPQPLPVPKPRWVVWLAVCALGVGLIAAGAWMLRRPAEEPSRVLRRFELRTPVATVGSIDMNRSAAISPDGKHVAFIDDHGPGRRLMMQHFDEEEPRVVQDGEGATDPFWSPDSRMVGFAIPTKGALMRAPVEGGVPIRICDLPPGFFSGATWSPDGNSIVFGSGVPGVLHEVPASGGVSRVVVSRDFLNLLTNETDASLKMLQNPSFLPMRGGKRVIVFSFGWADAVLLARDLDSGRTEILGPGRLPVFSPSGHLVFQAPSASQDLWAQPFSLDSLKTTGPAFPVARNRTDATVSKDGTMVTVDPSSNRLVWVNREGARLAEVGPATRGSFYPAISPDGKSVAVETREAENLDVWVYDLERGARTRLSTDPSTEILPVWSPDGQHVAYSSWRAGQTDIFIRRADASTEEKVLAATTALERISDWSRDGRYILYSREDLKSGAGADLWYLELTSKGSWEPHPFLETKYRERSPKFSPDGRYVAYLSNESGRDELHVRPFFEGKEQWVISRNGATQPRWARNGREIFFSERGTLMSVPVRTSPAFWAGAPVPLFTHVGFGFWWDPNYDVSPDGQRILMPEPSGGDGKVRRIYVVENWFEEFRNRR